jgi:hypothetical protein
MPLLLASAQAQTVVTCPTGKGYAQIHHIHGYVVRLTAGDKESVSERCLGSVTAAGTSRVVFARAWSLAVDPISGSDINGDGLPEVVFDGFTGGQGCCFVYTIVRLGKRPELVREIRNQVPLRIAKASDGSVQIRTGEGSFDLFLVPHGQAVIPELVLRLQGGTLTDISSDYREEYDARIARAQSELTPGALERFHSADVHKKLFADQMPTLRLVLTIVLNYLYSGREAQAWQALDAMWPPSDKERVRALIQERRSRGLLAEVAAR